MIRSAGDDRGSVTIMAVTAAAMVMALLALLAAGGVALRTRSDAFALASSAARTGAQQLDEAAAVEGRPVLDPIAAEQAALAYLAARGAHGSASVTDGTITVTVTSSAELPLGPALGIGSMSFTATSTVNAMKVEAP